MYGNEYVWILENHATIWWNTTTVGGCKISDLKESVEGVIMIGDFEFRYFNELFYNKMVSISTSFRIENVTDYCLQKSGNISDFYNGIQTSNHAKQSYDAVWTMALTLGASNVESLQDFNYGKNDVACTFLETMKRMEFVGLSVSFHFFF